MLGRFGRKKEKGRNVKGQGHKVMQHIVNYKTMSSGPRGYVKN